MNVMSIMKEIVLNIRGVNLKIGKNDLNNLKIRFNSKTSKIVIGERLNLREGVIFNVSSGTLIIGRNVFFSDSSKVNVRDYIEFGDNIIIGQNVLFYDHDHDYKSNDLRKEYKTEPVFIGDNTWIGSGAIILKGAKIGKNCVIGAGSIVKGNIPNNSIYYDKRERCVREIRK